MSIIKPLNHKKVQESTRKKNASEYKRYLEQGTIPGMSIYYEGCGPDWDRDFSTIAKEHGKYTNNIAIEFTESWGPEETEQEGFDKLFQMGIENAKKAFPHNSFIVVPHVNDNGNFHTHVLLCTIKDRDPTGKENGTRVRPTKALTHLFRQVCNDNARKHGLSTVRCVAKEKQQKLSHGARRAMQEARFPIALQIMKRADFSRAATTDLFQFKELMGTLGVRVVDKGKVLNYFHEGREKAIRGGRLGLLYTKEGLNEQFEKNKAALRTRPNLVNHLRGEIDRIFDERGNIVGDASHFPFPPGGHLEFKKLDGKNPTGRQLKQLYVNEKNNYDNPFYNLISDSVHRAATGSILEYCEANGIGLIKNKDGSHKLKGREHIHIRDNKWFNQRSKRGKIVGTSGTLIEFVSNHKRISKLDAISQITGNKNLMLLEDFFPKGPEKYQEFHIPQSKRKDERGSVSSIDKLLKFLGKNSDFSRALYNTKKVQVSTKGVIRFLLGDESHGALEFKPNKNGGWDKLLKGSTWSGFLSQKGKSEKLTVFKDPFTFMKETGGKGMMSFKHNDNVLVLGDGNMDAMKFFLASNNKVKNIDLLGFEARDLSPEKKMEITRLGMKINFVKEGGKGKNKGLELSI